MAITLNGTTGITTPKLDALDLELGSKNVVERGSNANGSYVRFADGTQICSRYVEYPSAAFGTNAGALFQRSSEAPPPYPAAFEAVHFVGMFASGSGPGVISAGLGYASLTSWPTQVLYSTTSAPQSLQLTQTVIGHWY